MDFTIGIDIGGTNFRIGMVGRDGEIINFEKNSSRIFDKGDVIETLYLNISDYMKRYNASDSIKAVAIGLPSMVSRLLYPLLILRDLIIYRSEIRSAKSLAYPYMLTAM